MFKIYDGRTEFFQWDLDRKIIVADPAINEVHFCNKTDDCSLVVEVYELDGQRVANVPNILLQSDWDIRVYGYCGGCYTKQYARYKVNARTKPADYIYTETEVKTLEGLEKRMDTLEYQYSEEGIKATVNDYLEDSFGLDAANVALKTEVAEVEEMAKDAFENSTYAVQTSEEALATINQANETAAEAKETADTIAGIAGSALNIANIAFEQSKEAKEISEEFATIVTEMKEDVDAFFADADLTENAKDTLKEIQEYINTDASAAAEMIDKIAANTDAIAELDEYTKNNISWLEEDIEACNSNVGDLYDTFESKVKSSITDSTEEWTDEDKTKACDLFGAVKAITSGGTYRCYGVDSAGNFRMWSIASSDGAANTTDRLAIYRNPSNSVTGTSEVKNALVTCVPQQPYQSANKKYVDDNFIAKYTESSGLKKIYGVTHQGEQTLYIVDRTLSGAQEGRIPLRGTKGIIYVPTESITEDTAAANKKYVDDEIALGATKLYLHSVLCNSASGEMGYLFFVTTISEKCITDVYAPGNFQLYRPVPCLDIRYGGNDARYAESAMSFTSLDEEGTEYELLFAGGAVQFTPNLDDYTIEAL